MCAHLTYFFVQSSVPHLQNCFVKVCYTTPSHQSNLNNIAPIMSEVHLSPSVLITMESPPPQKKVGHPLLGMFLAQSLIEHS